MVTLDELSEPAPPPSLDDWNDDGVVVLPGLLDSDMIKAYMEEWIAANGGPDFGFVHGEIDGRPLLVLDADEPGGWEDCTPYMRYPALRDLCCYGPLAVELERLIGEPAGVHLNLSGWVSTERDWHQDGYLNPPEVGDYYAAVWMALEDIHPDSGPFQYIPGSHRWHRLVREKFADVVDLGDPAWPKHTEAVLSPLVEDVVYNGRCPYCLPGSGRYTINCTYCVGEGRWPHEIVSYTPQKGDVLIWHPRLYHRGSKANVPGTYRPALIAHMSGINHRPDMPPAVQHEQGGWLFPIKSSGPVR